jgi:RHS repeat-associated protein
MRFESSTSDTTALPYRYNGKELEAMNGLNEYDYGARRRETGIPVWTTVDPLAEVHYNFSPYAYCLDNFMRYADREGLTEEERIAAVNYALNQVYLNTSYYQLDCSGLVSAAIVSSGMSNPINGVGMGQWTNGVARIVSLSRETPLDNLQVGNVVTFRTDRSDQKGSNGEYDHIGIVSDLKYENGKIIGFTFIHTTPRSGAHKTDYYFKKGLIGFSLQKAYQWDTPEYNLREVEINGKAPHEKTLEEQLEDMQWQSVRPNSCGNTGRYNKPGRTCDQYYSDEFLKWYYNDDNKNNNENK